MSPNTRYQVTLFTALVMLVISGCAKDDRVEAFRITHAVEFTIDPGLNTFDTYFYPFSPIGSSFQARLSETGLTSEDITAVEPRTALIRSIFGDENMEFIRRVSIRLYKIQEPDFNREIFYSDPVPFREANDIRPFAGLQDVKEILEEPFYGIELRLDFRFVPQRSIDMRLEFDLSAKRDANG